MKLKHVDISSILGYSVSAVMFVSGIIIMFGFLVSPYVPDKFRITFGIVMLLMGLYRFLMTRTRINQKRRDEEREEVQE